MYRLMLVLSVSAAILRAAGVKEAPFRDLVHVHVGLLLGLAIATRLKKWWLLFLALTAVELVAFFASR